MMTYTNELWEKRRQSADLAFQDYALDDDVTIEESDGWTYSSGEDGMTRTIYVRFDDDDEDAPTARGAFTVDFVEGSDKVINAMAEARGNDLGVWEGEGSSGDDHADHSRKDHGMGM